MDRDQTNEDARPQREERGTQGDASEQPAGGGGRSSRFAAGGARAGGGGGGGRRAGGGGGRGRGRKEPVFLPDDVIDYKDFQRLRRCLDERGKIANRRKTGVNAHQQRELTVAIKRARHMALLPFVADSRR